MSSGRYTLPTDAEARSAQQRWFLCIRCSGMHFVDASRGAGRCAAGGTHASGREYEIAMNTTFVSGDTQFRWCRRCECLVRGNNPAGCSAGGVHDTSANGSYVVRTDPSTLTQEDSFWRTCSRCSILMRLATADASAEGPCPLGGRHTPAGEYFVTMRTHVTKWRWCRRCELLALWDGSRPGPCPTGGTHDHSGSDFYFPPRRGEEAVQVVANDLRAGASYVADLGGARFEVVSITPTSATVRVTT